MMLLHTRAWPRLPLHALLLARSDENGANSVRTARTTVMRGRAMGVAYKGECENEAALVVFEAACVGKESYTVRHTEDFRAAARFNSGVLTVQAICRGHRGRAHHRRR
jgi:hypothetical protein